MCPYCKKEIKIQGKFITEEKTRGEGFLVGGNSEDLFTLTLDVPVRGHSIKMKDKWRKALIQIIVCNHCKMILGTG
ncbi:MAG: hypothetical protein ACFFEY_21440 [Candidatus Thorarchaeota archaeon]